MDYANVQMRKVDSKVEIIDKEVTQLKKQTVKEVRERQAETGDRLDYHQSEILRLQSELEENNFHIRQVQEENRELKKLLLARMETSEKNSTEEINHLKDRLALTEEQLLKAYDRLAFAENEIKSIKNSISEEASKRAMEAAQRAREAERKARQAAEREAAEKQKLLKRKKVPVAPGKSCLNPTKLMSAARIQPVLRKKKKLKKLCRNRLRKLYHRHHQQHQNHLLPQPHMTVA